MFFSSTPKTLFLLLSWWLVGCGGAPAPNAVPLKSGPAPEFEFASQKAKQDFAKSEGEERKADEAAGATEFEDMTEPTRKKSKDKRSIREKSTEPTAPLEKESLDKVEASPAALSASDSDDGDGASWAVRRGTRRAEDAIQRIEGLLGDYGGSLQSEGTVQLSRAASCSGTCELAEAICESSSVICDVAKHYVSEMSRDCEWASGECESANSLCVTCSEDR